MYQKAFRIFKQNPWQGAVLWGNLGTRVGSTDVVTAMSRARKHRIVCRKPSKQKG